MREPDRSLLNSAEMGPVRKRLRLSAGVKAKVGGYSNRSGQYRSFQGEFDADRPYLIVIRQGDGRVIREGDVFTALPAQRIRPGDKCVLWRNDGSPGLIAYRSSARARPVFKDLAGDRVLRGDWVAIHFICETGNMPDLTR
ncbi:MAG: hypothetical protein QNJ84_18905 [Alphaproteobacteria bacterium]|nr:hypothetical protein [Alphaproteobacteria bacterium]